MSIFIPPNFLENGQIEGVVGRGNLRPKIIIFMGVKIKYYEDAPGPTARYVICVA